MEMNFISELLGLVLGFIVFILIVGYTTQTEGYKKKASNPNKGYQQSKQ